MSEHSSMIETTARQQIAERVANASTQRLARHLPGTRRHRIGLGLRRYGEQVEN